MTDNEWKLQVTEELAVIKTDISYIKDQVKSLNKFHSILERVKTNRKLIFVILATYLPLLVLIYLNLKL